MSKQKVIICQDLEKDLTAAILACSHDKLFILVDEHTQDLCLPLIDKFKCLDNANIITIGAEDIHKNVETLVHVWTELGNGGATRHSLMLNLGGGMVTDLGGFAASTFKRGIKYINIPTTLLAMVDASVGGKTGINFNGLKNEIGVFSPAEYVLIDAEFLKSLDSRNLLSGYAEMLKHGIISTTAHWAELLNFDLNHIDYQALQALIAKSVQIKENIVEQLEQNSNCQNLPTNDVGELVKHNNNKNNPYEGIFVESNFTKGAFFGIVIPHKVPDNNWFCVVIQIQNNYYRIGVVYEKELYQNNKVYKNHIDNQANALLNYYERKKFNCFNGSFPYQYFNWAIDHKDRQRKDLLIENNKTPKIDTLIQRICSDVETISNILKQ
jgi:glycerol dehydrogenase-like iron-containing ADH family enzyme